MADLAFRAASNSFILALIACRPAVFRLCEASIVACVAVMVATNRGDISRRAARGDAGGLDLRSEAALLTLAPLLASGDDTSHARFGSRGGGADRCGALLGRIGRATAAGWLTRRGVRESTGEDFVFTAAAAAFRFTIRRPALLPGGPPPPPPFRRGVCDSLGGTGLAGGLSGGVVGGLGRPPPLRLRKTNPPTEPLSMCSAAAAAAAAAGMVVPAGGRRVAPPDGTPRRPRRACSCMLLRAGCRCTLCVFQVLNDIRNRGDQPPM